MRRPHPPRTSPGNEMRGAVLDNTRDPFVSFPIVGPNGFRNGDRGIQFLIHFFCFPPPASLIQSLRPRAYPSVLPQ